MNRMLAVLVVGFWLVISLISINHLFTFAMLPDLSSYWLGWLGWLCLVITLFFCCRKYLVAAILVFFCFFSFAYLTGPFLEPPADPLDHLRYTRAVCQDDSTGVKPVDSGFWHYSMSSVSICSSAEQSEAEAILRRVDFLHGIYVGVLALSLFVLSQSAGLPSRWGVFSVLCCLLFFGTNKFSYFSYYSFAPSFTSLAVYWLWISFFFFRKGLIDVFWGILAAILLLPILWINHHQEAAFLGIIVLVHLYVNAGRWVWLESRHSRQWLRVAFVAFLLFTLVVLPQITIFQDLVGNLLPKNFWSQNSARVAVVWHNWHLVGKFWSNYRVGDTLGIMGYIPIVLGVLCFVPGIVSRNGENRDRIIILGLIPFIGYCVPLLHLLWSSSVRLPVYYRLCYGSLFWLTIAYFLYEVEGRFVSFLKKNGSGEVARNIFFFICLAVLVTLSSARSAPLYGKLDFILVDSRSWWKEWRPMISSVLKERDKPVFSDYMTTSILHDVFGQPVHNGILRQLRFMRYRPLKIPAMENEAEKKRFRCLVNLHGFTPTWVPAETHHWNPKLADTSIFYEISGKRGADLEELLKIQPERNCTVFY